MSDLKRQEQRGGKATEGVGAVQGESPREENQGAEFGTAERATRGTNRDLDESGESMNQGHGHTREERGDK
jgi:hypothetical protein